MATATVTVVQPAGILALDVTWVLQPATPTSLVLEIQVATPSGWTGVLWSTPAASATTVRVSGGVPPLTGGQQVRARLTAVYLGSSVIGDSPPITLQAGSTPAPGPIGTTTPLQLAAYDVASLHQHSATSDAARRTAHRAAAIGSGYRAAYLRAEAETIAQQAIRVDDQLVQLQALDLAKVIGAQGMSTGPLQGLAKSISDLAMKPLPLPDLGAEIAALGAAALDLALLQRIVDWLARTDIIDFWYGLFGALLDDISHFNTEVASTKAYLVSVFQAPALTSTLTGLLDDVRGLVDGEVRALEGAVRAALGAATGAVSNEVRQLLAAADAPLLAAPPATGTPVEPSAADTFDADPFDSDLAGLRDQVDAQIAALRSAVDSSLASIAAGQDLFVALMLTYVALPILVAVGISLAGGPPAAALLNAAVFIAGQELLHLVAKWLSGPIGEQLDVLRGRVDDAKRALVRAVAGATANSVAAFAPIQQSTRHLHLASLFVRELSHLVPDAYLTATGDFLTRQRDSLIRHATELALAAELSQGIEHATVFDAIHPDYEQLAATRLPAAPQLPGGASRARHVAQTLLADLHRLDEQRLELVDGHEMVVTKRISLSELAGKASPATLLQSAASSLDPLAMLLSGRPVAIRLDEGDLLDGTHPGAYRALVEDVRIEAYVTPPIQPTDAIEVLLTHDGLTRTRVRRPGGAPDGLGEVGLRSLFARDVVARAYDRAIEVAQRWRKAWPANPPSTVSKDPPRWASVLARFVWEELQTAAGALELADLTAMRPELDRILREELGLYQIVDPNINDQAQLTAQTVAEVAARITGWTGFVYFPIPILNSVSPIVGDTSVAAPTPEQVRTWADAVARRLRERCRYLPTNPIRPGAKWGDHARLLEESEPGLRGIGYQTLERRMEPQARTYELLVSSSDAFDPSTAVLAGAGTDALAPERRRPMRDLGVTGTWVLQLPDAADDTSGFLTTAGRLRDLVLSFDLRVCHDPDLQAAIRFSRQRARTLDRLAAGPDRGPLRPVGILKQLDVVPAQRRTLQLSLRAQRNRTWIAWKHASDALASRNLPAFATAEQLTLADVTATSALDAWAPLKLLKGPLTSFRFAFGDADTSTLGGLAQQLVIDPVQLGVAPELQSLLGVLPAARSGALHSLGVAVVPHSAAPPGGITGATVAVGTALQPLTRQAQWPLKGLQMTPYAKDVPGTLAGVPLQTLFADPSTSTIEIQFGNALAAGWVYDIVMTLVYSPPVVHLAPATTELL